MVSAAEDNILSRAEQSTLKRLRIAGAAMPAAKRHRTNDPDPQPIAPRKLSRVFHHKNPLQAIDNTILMQLSEALQSSCSQTTDIKRAHTILVDDIANVEPTPLTFAALRGLALASSGPAGIALVQYLAPSRKKRVGVHITEAVRQAYGRATSEIMSHMDGEILERRPTTWRVWQVFRSLSEWEAFSREQPSCAFLLMRSSEFTQRSAAGHDMNCCHTVATFLKQLSNVSPSQ